MLHRRIGIVGSLLALAAVSAVARNAAERAFVPKDSKMLQAAQPIAHADAMFGLRLFQELTTANPGKNVVCSPESIAAALGMAYEGARGTTRTELENALALSPSAEQKQHASRKALQDSLNNADPQVTIQAANAIWVDSGVKLLPDYASLCRDIYQAGANTLPLSTKPADAANTINDWVKQKTQGMIPTIVQAGDLRSSAAVLTNAVYFKGLWSKPFEKSATNDQPFYSAPGKPSHPVKMMHRTGEMGYLRGEGFQAVRLPFGGREATPGGPEAIPPRFSLYVVLPDDQGGLPELLSHLDMATVDRGIDDFNSAQVTLSLPRVKLAFESEPNLNESLQRLGINSAFTEKADFSALCDHPTYISQVKHKAVVEIDEEGAKAAAATAVVMTRSAMPMRRREVMNVDHPFLFLIRDDATEAILFAGAVYDPQSANGAQ